MIIKTVEMRAKDGLHTRPAALVVKEAKRFQSDIFLEAGGKISNAKSLFNLQLLEITEGSTVAIRAEGSDETEAADHLADFLATME